MQSREIRNIIWDWNGTLLNDMDICIECMNTLLANRLLPRLSQSYYREVFTFPVKEYFLKIGFDFSKESFEVPAGEFVDLYNIKYREAGLFDEVHSVLGQLRNKGYKQYILSAQEKTQLSKLISYYGLEEYFEAVTGIVNNYAHSKVEAGKQMMEDHKLDRKESIMIGDTLHDYEVASSIGIPCLLLSHGHQSPLRLRSTGAPVMNSYEEIVFFIESRENNQANSG